MIRATTAKTALAKAKRIGKQREYNYDNDEGNAVRLERVGVMELIGLDPECLKDEVWYDIRTMLKPVERRKDILPKESALSAVKLECDSFATDFAGNDAQLMMLSIASSDRALITEWRRLLDERQPSYRFPDRDCSFSMSARSCVRPVARLLAIRSSN